MTGLVTNLQIKRPDEFFEALMTAHRELDDDQSRLLNAKLILLLANHIGDEAVLMEAIKAAGMDIERAQAAS
jgi:predicted DsbA family dithiol-disulfide isomerase